MTRYILPVDVGQADDFTAMGLIKPVPSDELHVGFAKRLALKTPYPKQVGAIEALAKREPIKDNVDIVVDYTGVGRPFVDMLREREGLCIIPVLITGGAEESFAADDGAWHVPKRVLVTCLQIFVQSQRLKIAQGIPIAEDIQREMAAFKATIKTNANVSYGNDWREAPHDDLVLMLALGAWWAIKNPCAAGLPPADKPADVLSEAYEEWSEAQLDAMLEAEMEERKQWGFR